jgi:hypothetical protein
MNDLIAIFARRGDLAHLALFLLIVWLLSWHALGLNPRLAEIIGWRAAIGTSREPNCGPGGTGQRVSLVVRTNCAASKFQW